MNMETILGRNIDLFFFEPFLPRFSITVTGHGLSVSRLVLSNLGRCSAFFLVSLQCSYRFFVFHRISFRRLLFMFNTCVLLRKHPCRNHDLAFAAEVHIHPFLPDTPSKSQGCNQLQGRALQQGCPRCRGRHQRQRWKAPGRSLARARSES